MAASEEIFREAASEAAERGGHLLDFLPPDYDVSASSSSSDDDEARRNQAAAMKKKKKKTGRKKRLLPGTAGLVGSKGSAVVVRAGSKPRGSIGSSQRAPRPSLRDQSPSPTTPNPNPAPSSRPSSSDRERDVDRRSSIRDFSRPSSSRSHSTDSAGRFEGDMKGEGGPSVPSSRPSSGSGSGRRSSVDESNRAVRPISAGKKARENDPNRIGEGENGRNSRPLSATITSMRILEEASQSSNSES